ncbi:EF-hand domain-containing protein [Chitiniphilus purpureus]|uniref:EF-hand domain-containing protein n=1 Tax=Chitiniphilus purpureus TaxID=2981137 RepID=A0ABY6DKH8_9NEIS|nr:EF-hand domain-containing protein [Chitiniphilus sp. CD1]UXY14879.1 EF-hand domain-containing protein [Chitiniphilus sp. CD1]
MKRWIMVLAAAGLAAGVAVANEPDRAGRHAVHDLSREQFVAAAQARFDRLDANHDGVVTQAERASVRELRRAKFQAVQGDVNMAQYLDKAKARFEKLDSDRNGVLTSAEREAHRPMRHHRHHHAHWPQGDVTRAEFTRQVQARFEALDQDRNGTVTRDEFRAQHRRPV